MIINLKLATTFLCYTIAIRKLNHIIINYFQNLQSSKLLNMWRFNICQDEKILEDDFDIVSSNIIRDNTLEALGHFFPLSYFKKRTP